MSSSSATTTATPGAANTNHKILLHKWGGRIVIGVVSVWLVTALLLHATLSRLEDRPNSISSESFQLYHNKNGEQFLHAPDLAFLRLGRVTSNRNTNHSSSSETDTVSASSLQQQQQQQQQAAKVAKVAVQKQQRLAVGNVVKNAPPPPVLKKPRPADLKEQQRQQLAPPKWYNPFRKRGTTAAASTRKILAARRAFEETHDPNDFERIQRVVQSWRVPIPPSKLYENKNTTSTTTTKEDHSQYYDIYNCPKTGPPSRDYPYSWPMRTILSNWNPDVTDIPTAIHASLCVFDWNADYDAIVAYRQAEVPFIVQNHDELLRTSERWMSGQTHLLRNDPNGGIVNGEGEGKSSSNYLAQLLGTERQRNEYSHTNHFMFWRLSQKKKQIKKNKRFNDDTAAKDDIYKDWQPPTDNVKLNYLEWYERAMALDQETAKLSSLDSSSINDRDHWYFRLNGMYGQVNDYLYDELPMFQPDQDRVGRNSIFMVEPDKARGINCRFGMKGVIAETHYDPTRNWIVLIGGQRRYILAHPRQCPHLHLYPIHHPSGRHSMVDWSNITHDASILKDARGTEVVLQAADALYLPTSWFHFIVSLNINYQCNARSGSTYENNHFITDCGFPVEEE
jgi:Cupin-like domain